MKKYLIGVALSALFATPGLANEPAKLSLAQMDKVTAGDVCQFCSNSNATYQANFQGAVGGSSFFSKLSSNALNVGVNVNSTRQEIN